MAEGINKYGATARPVRRAYAAPETRVKVKTDRAKNLAIAKAKQDVNAGLNSKEISTLQRIENAHRNRKTEQINIVDENGNVVLSKNGSATRVRMTNYEASQMKDRILTHNHPNPGNEHNGLGTGLAGQIGLTLSGADVGASIRNNAKEVRASAQGYVYSVKRPKGGWGNINSYAVEREINQARMGDFGWAKQYVNSAKTREEAYNRQGRYNVATQNAAMRAIAKKYGFTYTRRKMS